jgi:hypothetical protein
VLDKSYATPDVTITEIGHPRLTSNNPAEMLHKRNPRPVPLSAASLVEVQGHAVP